MLYKFDTSVNDEILAMHQESIVATNRILCTSVQCLQAGAIILDAHALNITHSMLFSRPL